MLNRYANCADFVLKLLVNYSFHLPQEISSVEGTICGGEYPVNLDCNLALWTYTDKRSECASTQNNIGLRFVEKKQSSIVTQSSPGIV